ncbi:unnamed protein product [Musa hybrid cultivar]
MAAGFGISGGRIGACGDDKRARLFIENMSDSDVDISRMRRKKGSTGQCALFGKCGWQQNHAAVSVDCGYVSGTKEMNGVFEDR